MTARADRAEDETELRVCVHVTITNEGPVPREWDATSIAPKSVAAQAASTSNGPACW
jgi:hypothetical protein